MKEIKFRVWDKEEKQMKSVDSIHFPLGKSSGKDISVYNEKEDYYEWIYDYEWMQYAGVKDRNGKEIYEGDIVECIEFIGLEYVHSRYRVFYDDEYISYSIGCLEDDVRNTIEVIGNIYENPELLD